MARTLIGIVQDLANFPPQDPAARKDLYNAALSLVYNTESVQDTAQRLYHGHVPLAMAQTGNDLQLFTTIMSKEDKHWTVEELAEITKAEPALLTRILSTLASYGMVQQHENGTYSASNITRNLAVPNAAAGIKHYSLNMTPSYNAIPRFLAHTNYRNPTTRAPFNLAFNTDLPVFQWRAHNPENAATGQAFMAAQRMGQRSIWTDARISAAATADMVLSDADQASHRTMFVDVGGGMGHQSLELRRARPDLVGGVVTQDLALATGMISEETRKEMGERGIEVMAHDFMTEQPVKGAKVYYLRNVLHNWNDAPVVVILKRLREAMKEDSVVVVDDVIMPAVGATWKQASMDIAMMTMLAAMERTKEHFARLFEEAGLRIRDVHRYDEEYGDSLIVAVPI